MVWLLGPPCVRIDDEVEVRTASGDNSRAIVGSELRARIAASGISESLFGSSTASIWSLQRRMKATRSPHVWKHLRTACVHLGSELYA